MSSKVISCGLNGLDCQLIDVEVDISPGLHSFTIVGLPDLAIQESKERVSAATKNSGFSPPKRSYRLTVNLAPADLHKQGPAYDLPIAIGFLLASKQLNFETKNKIFVGELALDGHLRPINGVLAMALMAKERGFETIFVPQDNAAEASLACSQNESFSSKDNLEIIPINTLEQLTNHLINQKLIKPYNQKVSFSQNDSYAFDMAYVKGQEEAKRAIEIAASGSHNLLMSGPPGSGKTLLARTMPSVLPSMSINEAIEVTKIFSIAGKLSPHQAIITQRPVRSPHHTASNVALVGGGSWPKPGEISLAHRGVLFLDEFPEFSRNVLESLRQPLEDGLVTVSRAQGSLTFPARFILVAAMNPCPCGFLGDPKKVCLCTPNAIKRYQKRISGPLLDRIDLCVDLPPVKYEKLAQDSVAESSTSIRQRVEKARKKQERRFRDEKIATNSEMTIPQIKKFCQIDTRGQGLLRRAVDQFHLSARGYHRLLKLARTIADLAESKNILSEHLAEAIQYRTKEESLT